ncbi:MAG: carbohydrate kinase family protein [Candidatus Marinimicrobia bacterium]|nr:carbohydrate kinase family protein [Candidatus Neomarinimicrobiota bacterium]
MSGHCDVFCIGNAVVDVVVRTVEELPPAGTIHMVEQVEQVTGGNGINTAMAVARMGKSVRLGAGIGADSFGALLREAVRSAGVDDTNLIALPGEQTGVTVVLVQPGGERRFLHMLGANGSFSQQHIDWSAVEGARVWHYASTFVLPAFDGPPLEKAIGRARALGCRISLDVCWDVQGRWLGLLQPVLAGADFLFCNFEEGSKLTGEQEPEDIAEDLRRMGVAIAVVKLGPAGCHVAGPEGSFASPGFDVTPIDTTGAGDCFAGAYLSAVLDGFDLEQAARFANAAGALATLSSGSAGIPMRSQVQDFLTARG